MARGRKKLEFDKVVFQKIIDELESKQEFVNPSKLWEAVCDTEWAKGLDPRPLTPAVAYMRAKQLNVTTKTKSGKRGAISLTPEHLAKMQEGRGKRRSRAEKMEKHTKTFVSMKKEYPAQFLSLIEKAQCGSLRAAIVLKCIECSGFNRSEARLCVISECALYPHRPSASDLEPESAAENVPTGDEAAREAIKIAQEALKLVPAELVIEPEPVETVE
jgi:hypothetical protein